MCCLFVNQPIVKVLANQEWKITDFYMILCTKQKKQNPFTFIHCSVNKRMSEKYKGVV